MNIHEYQAKDIFRAVRDSRSARRRGQPRPMRRSAIARALRHRRRRESPGARRRTRQGGRRQARASTPAEARAPRRQILGMQIKGLTVPKVLVTPAADIASEAYVGIIVDRASEARGVHGESGRRHRHRRGGGDDAGARSCALPVDPRYGLLPFEAIATRLLPVQGHREAGARGGEDHATALRRRSSTSGASLAEINPLVVDAGRRCCSRSMRRW